MPGLLIVAHCRQEHCSHSRRVGDRTLRQRQRIHQCRLSEAADRAWGGVEYTPVDGAKRNGRVERKLALIAEGARAAWLEFPRHFPDLEFPAKANSWHQSWPEAFTWMNDCLNTTAQVHTTDKLSHCERLYKKRPTNRLLPFMMPGFRHHNRKNKAESKGERCFSLNSGNNHSLRPTRSYCPQVSLATLRM